MCLSPIEAAHPREEAHGSVDHGVSVDENEADAVQLSRTIHSRCESIHTRENCVA